MNYLDFYGTSYQLNTLGKDFYKTGFSFASSLITIALVLVGGWFMGRDMFYKMNPKIIESSFLTEKTERVRVNNQNFTIAFRLEGYSSEPPSEEDTYAFPFFNYEIYKREGNEYLDSAFQKTYSPVPCTQIEATLSPQLQELNPETLNCFDMAQIKTDLLAEGIVEPDSDIDLFGEFQEDYVSAFYLVYTNCKYKDGKIDTNSCVPYEKAVELGKEFQTLALYVPRLIFDPEDFNNPLKTYYQSVNYSISPHSSMLYKMRYSLVTLRDDRGWLFEDIYTFISAELESEDKEYTFVTKEVFDSNTAELAAIDINFQKKQLHKTRIYMKIPELAANLGGLVKAVVMLLGFLTKTYNTFRIETELIAKYLAEKQESRVNENSTTNAIKKRQNYYVSLSFWEYLKLKCFNKTTVQKKLLMNLKERLDIQNLLQVLLIIQESNTESHPVAQFKIRDSR